MTTLNVLRHLPVAFRGLMAALILLPSVVLACPSCKDALEGDAVGRALSWTTLLLIAGPLVLFSSIGGWVFFAYRRAANAGAARHVSWPLWAEKESET